METVIAVIALVLILGLSIWYIIRAKKKGQKCIGCPYCKPGGGCSGPCGGCESEK